MDGVRLLRNDDNAQSPYGGGRLVQFEPDPARARALREAARSLPSHDLTPRQICDLELLAEGAFTPLTGFMGRADYESVCAHQRLADGRLWPVPVTLDIPEALADRLTVGDQLVLRDAEGVALAVLTVSEIFERDLLAEAENLYGTTRPSHPEVATLLNAHRTCVAGRLELIEWPTHYDFLPWRRRPAEVRGLLAAEGKARVLGYFPRHLLHRAHVRFTRRAALRHDAGLLILAAVGRRDHEYEGAHYARVRALRAAMGRYPSGLAMLNLVELSVRRCGARAALLQAIVARNYGCTHLVLEHDYDDAGEAATGEPCYGRYRWQEQLIAHERELGIETVLFRDLVQEEDRPELFLLSRPSRGFDEAQASELARWFSYPSVLREWQKPFRERTAQGLTIFFTGLSGAGKSTLARRLCARLMELGSRHVTLLDGDVVRKHLSAGLGFSREDRDRNVLRLGYVASLITQHRGVAICAPIAPYAATRAKVRAMVAQHGGFVEIYVSTPLSVCEARDRKGLYARARAGLIQAFTGISDPYEPPASPELSIDTSVMTTEQAVAYILAYLVEHGYLPQSALEAEATFHAGSEGRAGRLLRREGEATTPARQPPRAFLSRDELGGDGVERFSN
jgi:sulfate adenylyltransferase